MCSRSFWKSASGSVLILNSEMERPGWGILLPFLTLICSLLPAHGQDLQSTCADGKGSLFDFAFEGLDGSEILLSNLTGKAVLVVNVATY